MLCDTHCHLDDPALLSRLPEVLTSGKAAGVAKYIVPGVAPEGWDVIARLSREHAGIYPAFGLHPDFGPVNQTLSSDMTDIRRGLMRVGARAFFGGIARQQESRVIDEVVAAVTELARHRMGALICFEQEANLDEQILQLFDRIQIKDQGMRDWFAKALRAKNRTDLQSSKDRIAGLNRQITSLREQENGC